MKLGENNAGKHIKLRGSILSVPFLISAFLIVFAATGLKPTLKSLAKSYTKKSIDPIKPLSEFDFSELPSFREGWEFRKVDRVDEAVNTDEFILTYLFRKDLYKKPTYTFLLVTYYSDPRDTAPHSPDVCYRQAGAIVKQLKTITIDTSNLPGGKPSKIPAYMVVLDIPEGGQHLIIFTYCVEGVFRCKRWAVRWQIGKPGNRYTYFSKIEVAAPFEGEQEFRESVDLCKALLREALYKLVSEYFPSPETIKRR